MYVYINIYIHYCYTTASTFVLLYMFQELSTWDWKTYMGVHLWRKLILPFCSIDHLHLGMAQFRISPACVDMSTGAVLMVILFRQLYCCEFMNAVSL